MTNVQKKQKTKENFVGKYVRNPSQFGRKREYSYMFIK